MADLLPRAAFATMSQAGADEDFGRPEEDADKKSSLHALFERYRPALRAFFARRVRNAADADDLVQDVFVRLSRLSSSADIRNIEAFIFQTAVNLLRDHGRRAKAHQVMGALSAVNFEPQDEEPSPYRVVEAKAELSQVMAALGSLSERARNIFILRRLEQVKVDDIARFYGISVSAVEHHITRAQAHLAKTIKRP